MFSIKFFTPNDTIQVNSKKEGVDMTKLKKAIKETLITVQGVLFPNTYKPFDFLFKLLGLKGV